MRITNPKPILATAVPLTFTQPWLARWGGVGWGLGEADGGFGFGDGFFGDGAGAGGAILEDVPYLIGVGIQFGSFCSERLQFGIQVFSKNLFTCHAAHSGFTA